MSDNENSGAGGGGPSIPVGWHMGTEETYNNPGQVNKTPDVQTSALVRPTDREMAVFSDQRVKTCGSCKFYDVEKTQREFQQTNGEWFKILVHDWQWKLRHLGAHPKQLARCSQRDDTLVGPNSRACEFYKLKR